MWMIWKTTDKGKDGGHGEEPGNRNRAWNRDMLFLQSSPLLSYARFMKRFGGLLNQRRLLGSAVILASTQFGASIAGLLRDRFLASTFPGLGVVDAYLAAFRPSDLLFQTCVVSAMGTVLVPVLARYRARQNHHELDKVLSGTIGITALLFGGIALVLAVVFPLLVPLFHIEFTGKTLDLYIQFGRLALLSNFLFVFGNAYGQYLVTVEKFWMYGLTPILYTAGTIFGTLVLTPMIGPYGPMVGTVLGAVMYVALRMYAVHRAGGKLSISLWHPDIPHMGKLMLPRIFALGAFQIQLLYLTGFATGLPQGSVTVDNFARNFQSVLVGVIGIALAQAIYSRMSQAAAMGKMSVFRRYYWLGMVFCIVLTIPGAIALVLISPLIVWWFKGLSGNVHLFTVCLGLYAISIPFESATHIQYRAFYSLKDTVLPAVMGVVGGLVAIGVAQTLLLTYGLYALAIGYTCGEIFQAVGLGLTLPWRMRHRVDKVALSVANEVAPMS